MDRRKFMGGLFALSAMPHLSGKAQAQLGSSESINVVDRFGFVRDGRTDNADAFHRWANWVNQSGGGSYVFPPGRYYVRRYRTGDSGGTEFPTIADCDGLSLAGYGACIILNGAFHRSAEGRARGADKAAFMPFQFRRCRNLRMSGFEVDGGVRSMTRDSSVTEMYSHLVALRGCSNVLLKDLHLHHSQTDGLLLYEDGRTAGRPGTACRNVRLDGVRCSNNARGAFAPIQIYGLLCTDCCFEGSAFGLGKYVGHAPGFGVDVEPDYSMPADIDVKTGNLEFRRCSFVDNVSAFLAAYPQNCSGYLRIIDCTSSNAANQPHHMIVNWPGALIEGGRHDAGAGTLWTSWNGPGGDLTIRDTEIRSSGRYGIFHAHSGCYVRLERMKIVGEQREASEAGWLLAVHGQAGSRRNVVRQCSVFVPKERKIHGQVYDYEVSLHHTSSEDNIFETDLPASDGSHFCTEYGPDATALRDRYKGTAPGPRDSFRPAHMANFDTRQPFSHG